MSTRSTPPTLNSIERQLRRAMAKIVMPRPDPTSGTAELWQEILRLRRTVAYYKKHVAEMQAKFGATAIVAPPEQKPRALVTEKEREIHEARAALVEGVRRLGVSFGVTCTIDTIVRLAQTGKLPKRLRAIVSTANARRGVKGRTLSRRSLFHWMRDERFGKGGAS